MKTMLLGDLSPTIVTDPLFERGDIRSLFTDTLSLFDNNDVNFVNLECALTVHDVAIKKFGPPLKATPNVAKVLHQIGVNYCGLSNNHIFDYGIRGAVDTMKYLDETGIIYTGFGKDYEDSRKDLIIEKNGEKVGIITVCEHEYSYALEDRMGSRPFSEFDTIEDIRAAKAQCDRVIVIYHGGKGHCRYPSPRLVNVCRAMARNGADVVLCQHSHCIGCYEYYKDCHILYGQGNYHFIKNGVPETWNGAFAVAYDTVNHAFEVTPIVNTDNGITLAKGSEKEQMLAEYARRNQELANGQWRKGWHAFCLSVKERYHSIIGKACTANSDPVDNDWFSHYLDCEAHSDVWRELFPTYNQTNEK